ncbi:hypothetical protein [Streptomyces sp. NPDC058297]|uniref:hypothetical protein n=1 Tax=Streptomyces sp. NPDC058297 TaxID=3346433 RepID=UPI0036E5A784
MFKKSKSRGDEPLPTATFWSPRAWVLAVLGAITLGVAVLSVAVSYSILVPRFGVWAAPTVGALDALWVVLQATEILSGNNRSRAGRVKWAGVALTFVIAAVPTADLITTGTGQGLDLAVVLTPVAIVSTKLVWWLVMPSLGRRVSPATRQAIAARRQEVADKLERMEADAADRTELLRVAEALNRQVTEAETSYRLSALKAQQTMTEELHTQAETTAKTISEKPLPGLVAQIELPELEGWVPAAPALPVTPVTQVRALMGPQAVTSGGTPVTLEELAAVTGVPTPRPGETLTEPQLDLVVRHLRYSDDPPRSYRQSAGALREAGFIGSEERVRKVWGALMQKERESAASRTGDASETADEADEEESRG